MVAVAVGAKVVDISCDGLGAELAVGVGQGKNLVSRSLDGARLVDIYMSRIGRHRTLKGAQQSLDHGGVGLGAARKQVNLGPGRTARFAYACTRRVTYRVTAVAVVFVEIDGGQALQYRGMRTLHVVAVEMVHLS